MNRYLLLPSAEMRINEIYDYSYQQWGEEQAETYTRGLYACCADIGTGKAFSRNIPTAFKIAGKYTRYHQHFFYWRQRPDGIASIITILHQSMHQEANLRDDMA